MTEYQRGYSAGLRRAKQSRENAVWQQFMVAALSTMPIARTWIRGDKKLNSLDERVGLAADFADAAFELAQKRGRV